MRNNFLLVTVLLLLLQVCFAQWNHPPHWTKESSKLKSLQVVCGKDYMTVYIEFSSAFNGLVFSKGKYGQSSCVYVNPHSGITHANFDVYYDKCGTKPDNYAKFYENTIIIQYGTDVIEAWDEAKRLRCEWHNAYEKPASKPGIKIADIEIVELEFQGDNVDCWMEIQEGKGPWAQQVSGIVPIGSPLTMVIAINDHQGQFDMRVKSCHAYNRRKIPVFLTDDNGCVLRPKMLTPFLKVRDYNGRASVVSYSHFYAFKFPDTMDVHVQCKVEICRHGCPESCPVQNHKQEYQESEDNINYVKPDPTFYKQEQMNFKEKQSDNSKNPLSDVYIVHSEDHQTKSPYQGEKVSKSQLLSHIANGENYSSEKSQIDKKINQQQTYIKNEEDPLLHKEPTKLYIHNTSPKTKPNDKTTLPLLPEMHSKNLPPELAQHVVHYLQPQHLQSFHDYSQVHSEIHSSEKELPSFPHNVFAGQNNFKTEHRFSAGELPSIGPVYDVREKDATITKHNKYEKNYNPMSSAFVDNSYSVFTKTVEHVTPKSTTIVEIQPVYFIQPQQSHSQGKHIRNQHKTTAQESFVIGNRLKLHRSNYPYPIPQFMPRHPMYGMSQLSDRMDSNDHILPLITLNIRPGPRSMRHRRSTESEFGVQQTYLAIAYNDLDFELNSTKEDTPIYTGKSESEVIYGICLSVSNFAACLSLLISLSLCSLITALSLYHRSNKKLTDMHIAARFSSKKWLEFYRS